VRKSKKDLEKTELEFDERRLTGYRRPIGVLVTPLEGCSSTSLAFQLPTPEGEYGESVETEGGEASGLELALRTANDKIVAMLDAAGIERDLDAMLRPVEAITARIDTLKRERPHPLALQTMPDCPLKVDTQDEATSPDSSDRESPEHAQLNEIIRVLNLDLLDPVKAATSLAANTVKTTELLTEMGDILGEDADPTCSYAEELKFLKDRHEVTWKVLGSYDPGGPFLEDRVWELKEQADHIPVLRNKVLKHVSELAKAAGLDILGSWEDVLATLKTWVVARKEARVDPCIEPAPEFYAPDKSDGRTSYRLHPGCAIERGLIELINRMTSPISEPDTAYSESRITVAALEVDRPDLEFLATGSDVIMLRFPVCTVKGPGWTGPIEVKTQDLLLIAAWNHEGSPASLPDRQQCIGEPYVLTVPMVGTPIGPGSDPE